MDLTRDLLKKMGTRIHTTPHWKFKCQNTWATLLITKLTMQSQNKILQWVPLFSKSTTFSEDSYSTMSSSTIKLNKLMQFCSPKMMLNKELKLWHHPNLSSRSKHWSQIQESNIAVNLSGTPQLCKTCGSPWQLISHQAQTLKLNSNC